ncbi:MAG: bifunctional isocitrate dehydrogenase kinase/phosphatase [Pseudomonadota bacterium]
MTSVTTSNPKQSLDVMLSDLIFSEFERYGQQFRAITQSSGRRFETRDWAGAQEDARRRIELYDRFVLDTIARIDQVLGAQVSDEALWGKARSHYEDRLGDAIDRELNKTFFNSVSRRRFSTVGVNAALEFAETQLGPTDHVSSRPSILRYPWTGDLRAICQQLLQDYSLGLPWEDRQRCVRRLGDAITSQLAQHGGVSSIRDLEVIRPLFYRNTRAFIVGRICLAEKNLPLLVALENPAPGIRVDWVTTAVDEASSVFSYSRSYFHADLISIADAVKFLKGILPHKPVEELYSILGRAKQAKTERYRGIYRHLQRGEDRFVPAPGIKGMVMAVFTLDSYPVVFKVIRDRFAPPKKVTHQDVKDRYLMVYTHNRAGRLVDAQEFKQLRFPLDRFSEEVLTELREECADSVSVVAGQLVIQHLYIERRLEPLNLYLNRVDAEQQRRIVLDYGQAIRDLAMTDIFPGDLLLKNFGVSRSGRVIFYDYDELCSLDECRFRNVPRARYEFEEFGSDVWYEVAPEDVFPAQFPSFLGLTPSQLAIFRESHEDLLTAAFWNGLKERLGAGEVFDVAPYSGSWYGQSWR